MKGPGALSRARAVAHTEAHRWQTTDRVVLHVFKHVAVVLLDHLHGGTQPLHHELDVHSVAQQVGRVRVP